MAFSTVALRRDLSRAEMGLALLGIIILVVVFLQRMREVEANAESTMLVTAQQTMQRRLLDLHLKFVTGGVAARPLTLDDVASYVAPEATVMALTATDFDWRAAPPGTWVYFRDQARLDYRVTSEPARLGAGGQPARVGFQFIATYADKQAGSDQQRRVIGARIERLRPGAVMP